LRRLRERATSRRSSRYSNPSAEDSGDATPAWQCGEDREAERLITKALSGTPPETIAEELRDLFLQVYFEQSPRKKRRPLSAPSPPAQES
jgi:hypothetical protein